MDTVVVVGASLAGLRAAETVRQEGHDRRLVLVGAEEHLPYDRPPLSKQLLAGKCEVEQIVLRPAGCEDLDLELRLGCRAVALDLDRRQIELYARERLALDVLI